MVSFLGFLIILAVIGGALWLMENNITPNQGVQTVAVTDSRGNYQRESKFDRVFNCPWYGLGRLKRKYPSLFGIKPNTESEPESESNDNT